MVRYPGGKGIIDARVVHHRSCGVYTLRRTNAPPFDQLGWSISRASIKATANVQPGSAQARHLVSGGC